MRSFIQIFSFAIIFACCSSPGKEKKVDTKIKDSIPAANEKDNLPASIASHFKITGDSVEIPSFEIEVSLSEKAEKTIKAKKEWIIVTTYLSGIPKDTTKYMEDGEYAVGTHSISLVNSRNAKFEGVKISKAAFESLADKDIQVLINVYSGRRTSKLNMIDCELLQKPISQVAGKKFALKGKLIGE